MKVEILVPDTLSDITLGQYQKYLSIVEGNDDASFMDIKMIEIFCGVKLSETLKMKFADIKAVCDILEQMLLEKPQLVNRFKMNGVEYGFIPNLEQISMGEFIDIETFLSDWKQMHRAMAVLYRPIAHKYGDKYNIEEYKETDGEHMRDIPMDAVFGCMLFFYSLGIDLSQAMMTYLQDQEETALMQFPNLGKDGDGINQFTHSLREILQDLRISPN
jgi:hypothetical protein